MNLRLIIGVLRELKRLEARDRWPRDSLAAYQRESLATLREWTYANSPFYREFHHGLTAAPLGELPILTKRQMMEHFDSFVTDREAYLSDVQAHLASRAGTRFRDQYEVVATSGSTGTPGIFLFGPQEWVTILASFARAREWAGLKVRLTHRSRMAVVSSTNERNLSARIGKMADTPFLPTLRLEASQPMGNIVGALNDWRPEVLVAYASMAYFLAGEQMAGTLHISPRAVFTSSEVLTPQMRGRLERVWGDVVFNEYASTETATIAAEDAGHHGMHVFEDLLIVENVDAEDRPVAPGTFGEKLLVTVLFSRTQPLIRYEISDSVRFAAQQPRCDIAFRTIDGVEGRAEDVLVLPGPGNQPVRIHPNVFHDAMDLVPNNGWQVVQESDGLDVLIVHGAEPVDADGVRGRIESALQGQGALPLAVRVSIVAAIPKAASGKTPLIKAL
jgi:phenylacetate-CoA ligase